MSDRGGCSLSKLAELTGSILFGSPETVVSGVADLESASRSEASFLSNLRYLHLLETTEAGAIFISPEIPRNEKRTNFLVHNNPSQAFQIALEFFYTKRARATAFTAIHPTAVVHESASLGKEVSIGPYAVIDGEVSIGEGSSIGAHCYLGYGSSIGKECRLHPHVVIREACRLGDRVEVQPGAVIGSCGFGYIQDERGRHRKLKHLGSVEIESDVEVGANAAVDRARFQLTKIGEGSKIDNLVQIAHGAQLGKHLILAAQTGIAGSTRIGDHTMMGGQVAVNGHIEIAPKTLIAAKSGVSKSLPTGKYSGIPAYSASDYNRDQVLLRKIGTLFKRVEELEKLAQRPGGPLCAG